MGKQKIIIALLASLIFTGCRAEETTGPQAAAGGTEITEGIVPEADEKAGEYGEMEESVKQPARPAPVELSGKAVGIEAHIKEVKEQEILISSDSDGFPGVFEVEVPESVSDISLLEGGTSVRILMEEKAGTDGNSKYLAKSMEIVKGQGEAMAAGEEKPLASPPVFVLSDPLSSLAASFEIHPGNYNWNYKDGDEMAGVIACGAHPLDGFEREKMEIPQYRGMETAGYLLSAEVPPDMLKISVWDAGDIGNTQAEALSEITFYYPAAMLGLEKEKVYEFVAVWEQDKLEQRGFYGDAGYVLVTE